MTIGQTLSGPIRFLYCSIAHDASIGALHQLLQNAKLLKAGITRQSPEPSACGKIGQKDKKSIMNLDAESI